MQTMGLSLLIFFTGYAVYAAWIEFKKIPEEVEDVTEGDQAF